jgi:hypothetical protein
MANYLRLAEGMSYERAVEILGESGEEISRSDIAGITAVMYSWKASRWTLAPAKEGLSTDRDGIRRRLGHLDAEVQNIIAAITAGGEVNALVVALKERETEREQLRRRLASKEAADRRLSVTPARLRDQLAARLADWRGVLHRQPTQARPILKKLLAGPLQFKPEKGGYYSFEGEISFAKIFSDLGVPFSVASPPGSVTGGNPILQAL